MIIHCTAPGGTVVQETPGKLCRTETCLFGGPEDSMEHLKSWEQVSLNDSNVYNGTFINWLLLGVHQADAEVQVFRKDVR